MVPPTTETQRCHEDLIAGSARIRSLAEFDAQVRILSDAWFKRFHARPKAWFRGHADSTWFLAPPTLRDPYFQRGHYDEESHTFVEFKRRAVGLVGQAPRTEWGWLYFAQHHGLPTRLLDWTEASHVALFFALGKRQLAGVADACVWMLNPGALNEKLWGFSNVVTVDDEDEKALVLLSPYLHAKPPEKAPGIEAPPLAIIPEYVTPRLRAQRGAFVAFAENRSALINMILDDTSEHPSAPIGKPLVIDACCSEEIERELDFAGVASSTVFPDVDGLCSELTRRLERGRL